MKTFSQAQDFLVPFPVIPRNHEAEVEFSPLYPNMADRIAPNHRSVIPITAIRSVFEQYLNVFFSTVAVVPCGSTDRRRLTTSPVRSTSAVALEKSKVTRYSKFETVLRDVCPSQLAPALSRYLEHCRLISGSCPPHSFRFLSVVSSTLIGRTQNFLPFLKELPSNIGAGQFRRQYAAVSISL
jgi:hypothetical protein